MQTVGQHRHCRCAPTLGRGNNPPRRICNGPTASLREGGEVTSAKEVNEGREWLSAAAMTVNGEMAVGL